MTAAGSSIVGARPELVRAYSALRAVVAQEHPGLVWSIAEYGGLRTEADTALILRYRDVDWAAALKSSPTLARTTTKEAWRPISPWGSSHHNYGAAFDVVVTSAPVGMSRLAALNILKDYAPVVGLVDGRTFTHPDPPHFQLPETLAEAKARWRGQTGTNVFTDAAASSWMTVALIAGFAVLAFVVTRRGSFHV